MSRHVLIVDDEKNIRRTFKMVLETEGFVVSVAETGEQALELFHQDKPDAVILDVQLPGIDGIETLRRLKDGDGELPVIMISGHGTIATAVAATRSGAFDFVEKPLSRERLLVAVRNALKVQSLGREVRAQRARDMKRHMMVG